MSQNRLILLMGLLLAMFLALLGRIFYYQIVKGEEISRAAVSMRSQPIELEDYRRGDILDRNLVPLTNTRTSSAAYCLPGLVAREADINTGQEADESDQEKRWQDLALFLSHILKNKDQEEILTRLKNSSGSQFVRLDDNLSPQEIEAVDAAQVEGLVVAPVINRYRDDGYCAHLLGYAGKGAKSEGKSGIEKTYDHILQGSSSSRELVSVFDARGKPIEGLNGKLKSNPDQGGSVVLTIDKRIQDVVEAAMNDRVLKGAVVVMDVHSKEILAMASRPTFNPDQINDIIAFDNRSTLINRALSRYNPGSLFKILLGSAALEEGIVTMDEPFTCTGKYVFNDQVTINCWKEEGHGSLTFASAFANSCNPTFIKVGLRLGRSRILNYVDQMHLTDETIIGYDPGPIGTYVKIDGGEPALGNASLGQQGVMVSPVQIASLLSTVADGGVWAPPALVRYTVDQKGNRSSLTQGQGLQVISPATAAKVRQLMEKTVMEGTGKTAAIPEVQVAGKTATCQTGRMDDAGEEILNTWFAGYLPAQNPRWAIVVMSEEGSSGSENCAPIFKDISRGILQFN
ncbi:MAG: penicillin-binding protein 2 [Syntrophomonadaceae bacterium]|nr:penicillin-binding protein 2 [Syntrophomonadaceae bacterium]